MTWRGVSRCRGNQRLDCLGSRVLSDLEAIDSGTRTCEVPLCGAQSFMGLHASVQDDLQKTRSWGEGSGTWVVQGRHSLSGEPVSKSCPFLYLLFLLPLSPFRKAFGDSAIWGFLNYTFLFTQSFP